MKVKIDFPIYKDLPDGTDEEIIYEIECYLTPYDPGRTYGPPEKCYPPEGGDCEILSVKLNGVEVKDWETIFNAKAQEEIAVSALEAAPSKEDGDDPRGWEPGGDR